MDVKRQPKTERSLENWAQAHCEDDGAQEYSKLFAPSKVSIAQETGEPGKGTEPLERMVETIVFAASRAGRVTKLPSHMMAAASCDLARQLLDMKEKYVKNDYDLSNAVRELKAMLRQAFENCSQWPKVPPVWRYRSRRLALLLALDRTLNSSRCWHKRSGANLRCKNQVGQQRKMQRRQELEALRVADDSDLKRLLLSVSRSLLCRRHHQERDESLLTRLVRSPERISLLQAVDVKKSSPRNKSLIGRRQRKRGRRPEPGLAKPPNAVQRCKSPKGANLTNNFASPFDNEGRRLVIRPGKQIKQYHLEERLGQGTYGTVYRAYDEKRKTRVALKFSRSSPTYVKTAEEEYTLLCLLQKEDPDNKKSCIRPRGCFEYEGHICIVTDLLNQSLFDFLKGNNFAPFPNNHIKSIARQLLTSVSFLHHINYIHTDLKTANILLYNNMHKDCTYICQRRTIYRDAKMTHVSFVKLLRPDICLIDFGCAVRADEPHDYVVTTWNYRAPEVILGSGWSFPCDIWSVGCILVELYLGDLLFKAQLEVALDHLGMMQAVCGHLDGNNRPKWPSQPATGMKTLDELFAKEHAAPDDPVLKFLDLLGRMFQFDPDKRITAADALKHDWFGRGGEKTRQVFDMNLSK